MISPPPSPEPRAVTQLPALTFRAQTAVDELRGKMQGLVAQEGIDKSVALEAVQLFHALELLFHREVNERDARLVDAAHRAEVSELRLEQVRAERQATVDVGVAERSKLRR